MSKFVLWLWTEGALLTHEEVQCSWDKMLTLGTVNTRISFSYLTQPHTQAHTLRSASRSPSGRQAGSSTLRYLCQGPQRCERIGPRFLSSLSKYGKWRWPEKSCPYALCRVGARLHAGTYVNCQTADLPLTPPPPLPTVVTTQEMTFICCFFKSCFIRPTLLFLRSIFFSTVYPIKCIQSERISCNWWLCESVSSWFLVKMTFLLLLLQKRINFSGHMTHKHVRWCINEE